jgi:hypothetical protein
MVAQRSELEIEPISGAPSPNRSWALLTDLQNAHIRLTASIKDLAKLTGQPSSDKVQYSAVRFRVSEASLARRITFRAACDYLLQVAAPADQQTISRLRSADADLAKHASKHVQQWTTANIDRDWAGYCVCSVEMRSALLKQIELERSMLYPLLHQHGSCRRSQVRLIPIDEFLAEEAAAR